MSWINKIFLWLIETFGIIGIFLTFLIVALVMLAVVIIPCLIFLYGVFKLALLFWSLI